MDPSVVELPIPKTLELFRQALEGALVLTMTSSQQLQESLKGKYQRRVKAYCTEAYDEFVRDTCVKMPIRLGKKFDPYISTKLHMRETIPDESAFALREETMRQLATAVEAAVCKERMVSQAVERDVEEAGGCEEAYGEEESKEFPDITKSLTDSIKFLRFEHEMKQSGAKALARTPPARAPKPLSLGEILINAFLYEFPMDLAR